MKTIRELPKELSLQRHSAMICTAEISSYPRTFEIIVCFLRPPLLTSWKLIGRCGIPPLHWVDAIENGFCSTEQTGCAGTGANGNCLISARHHAVSELYQSEVRVPFGSPNVDVPRVDCCLARAADPGANTHRPGGLTPRTPISLLTPTQCPC